MAKQRKPKVETEGREGAYIFKVVVPDMTPTRYRADSDHRDENMVPTLSLTDGSVVAQLPSDQWRYCVQEGYE